MSWRPSAPEPHRDAHAEIGIETGNWHDGVRAIGAPIGRPVTTEATRSREGAVEPSARMGV